MTNHDALNIQLDNIKRYKLYNMIFVNILLRDHLYEFVTNIFAQKLSLFIRAQRTLFLKLLIYLVQSQHSSFCPAEPWFWYNPINVALQ